MDLELITKYLKENEGLLLEGKYLEQREQSLKKTDSRYYQMTKLVASLGISRAIVEEDRDIVFTVKDHRDLKNKLLFKYYLVKKGSKAHVSFEERDCDPNQSKVFTCAHKEFNGWMTFYYADTYFEGFGTI